MAQLKSWLLSRLRILHSQSDVGTTRGNLGFLFADKLGWWHETFGYGTTLENQQKRLRESVQKNGFIWDFVPNIGPHPPTALVWDSTKWEVNVRFVLLFRLFRAFCFFEKMRDFSDKVPCIYLRLWTPTHPPPPLFWDRVLKKDGFLFSLKSLGLWTPTYP